MALSLSGVLRSGDWCLRLLWPGTPVASFRWGRVVTITVSPETRPALLVGMQSAVAVLPRLAREQPTLGSVAGAPHAHPSPLARGQPTRGTPRTRPIPTRHSLREQPTPGSVAGAPRPWPVAPCVGTTGPARRRGRTSDCEYGPSRPRAFRRVPTPRGTRIRRVLAAGPHRLGWAAPIPAAQRVRRGPPGAPGYGHRPAPAHCAGGP